MAAGGHRQRVPLVAPSPASSPAKSSPPSLAASLLSAASHFLCWFSLRPRPCSIFVSLAPLFALISICLTYILTASCLVPELSLALPASDWVSGPLGTPASATWLPSHQESTGGYYPEPVDLCPLLSSPQHKGDLSLISRPQSSPLGFSPAPSCPFFLQAT